MRDYHVRLFDGTVKCAEKLRAFCERRRCLPEVEFIFQLDSQRGSEMAKAVLVTEKGKYNVLPGEWILSDPYGKIHVVDKKTLDNITDAKLARR